MEALTDKPPVAKTASKSDPLSEITKITKSAKARLNATDITYIETSFSQLAKNGEQLIADFYRALFQLQPELRGLFETNSEKGQHKKMLAALTLLVNNLRYPDVLEEYLTALGMRHQIYGVSAGQMRLVSVALMSVLKRHAGTAWQAEIERAWREMLMYVTNTMLGAYQPTEEHTMAVTVLNEDQHSSLLSGSPILDNANTAMMIVDRELTITYANPALTAQLVEHEAAFRQQSAEISVTQLVGTHVELLFPQPQQARQLLTDPRQLPQTTELKIGSLIFRVTLSALWQGNECAGTLLEWHNVTAETLRNADIHGQFEALDRVMGIISFNMDGTIIDVNDNFLSVVGYRKEEVVGHHHRLFVTPEYAVSREYQDFWAGLNRSEPQSGEFQRVGFGGKAIWLQASYIPIFDTNGIPYKVVKYASDITEEKLLQMTVESVLSATAVVMKAMAAGDLTQQLQGEYEDEFAQLQVAVNDTVVNMATIVQDISDASISISAAASEISQGNLDLSQRTEEQAASLEETASSLEELTSTVRQNSDNARHANQLASDARERAEKGGGVIKRAIDAMTAISQSSKKVADIIGVIDEIAFQTNLLALNAAVEAARAGEQGRGFAVVAAEVRNLAQRSAAAAKEIKELIRDSGEKVSEGASLVDESGRTLDDIVESAKKVGDIISEIAAASIEQTAGIEQVNKAVTQMDEMTQQNAALVEQAAAASESLDEQGQSLQQKMAFFNTGRRNEPVMIQPAVRAIPPHQTATTPVKTRRGALQQDDEWKEF